MENIRETHEAHVVALPYQTQGHINPMLQFCRRLASKGVKVSLVITNYISNTLNPKSDDHVRLVTISDGCDKGGFFEAQSIADYLIRLETIGSHSLGNLIESHVCTHNPITCLVYDSFFPWALNVARKYGLVGACFFTQSCAVNYVYYLVHHEKLTVSEFSSPVSIPGLPPLDASDLPSLLSSPESYPAYYELVLNQYLNLDKADFVLVNTFYELEDKVVDIMSKEYPLLTIGPTVPSIYLDNRLEYDKDYGLNLYRIDSTPIISWLSTKPPRSVVYVSFGSLVSLSKEQMEELAWGLKGSNFNFLWVVGACEEGNLPKGFADELGEKGLIVTWTQQLEVFTSEAIGCFFTHCGWNSTLEALVFGLPMVGMSQWTDQPTNAKLIEDVWKVGVRVKADVNGLVRREEITNCVIQVMAGGKRGEIVKNAKKWKDLAKEAISEGGSSDRNIDEFVSKISCTR